MKMLMVMHAKLIWRAHLVWVYIVITAIYGYLLHFINAKQQGVVLSYVLFTDPVMLASFFMGVLVLMENQQGARLSLSICPVSHQLLLLAKFLPLFVLTVVSVFVLTYIVRGFAVHVIGLLISVFVGSYFSAALLLWVVSRVKQLVALLFWVFVLSLVMNAQLFLMLHRYDWLSNWMPSSVLFHAIYQSVSDQPVTHWGGLLSMFVVALLINRFSRGIS